MAKNPCDSAARAKAPPGRGWCRLLLYRSHKVRPPVSGDISAIGKQLARSVELKVLLIATEAGSIVSDPTEDLEDAALRGEGFEFGGETERVGEEGDEREGRKVWLGGVLVWSMFSYYFSPNH